MFYVAGSENYVVNLNGLTGIFTQWGFSLKHLFTTDTHFHTGTTVW